MRDKQSPDDTFRSLAAIAVVIGIAGIIGLALAIGLEIAVIVLIFQKSWPWFSPEPSLVQVNPEGFASSAFWLSIVLLVLSLVARVVRRAKAGFDALGPAIWWVVSSLLWYLHARIILGTASYYIFRWFCADGGALRWLYVAACFFGGLSPGFLSSSGIMLYVIYQDPMILSFMVLPGVIGDVIDGLFGEVLSKEEREKRNARDLVEPAN